MNLSLATARTVCPFLFRKSVYGLILWIWFLEQTICQEQKTAAFVFFVVVVQLWKRQHLDKAGTFIHLFISSIHTISFINRYIHSLSSFTQNVKERACYHIILSFSLLWFIKVDADDFFSLDTIVKDAFWNKTSWRQTLRTFSWV